MMKKIATAIGLAALLASCPVLAGETGKGLDSDSRYALFQKSNVFHSGLRGTHTIALTFDDGPAPATIGVLDALKKYNIKATFFVLGRNARTYPSILKRIADEGHLLANHSNTHPLLGKKYVANPEALIAQIRATDVEITPLMAPDAKFYFRAPYGSWRTQHAAVLNADPVLKKYVGPIYWDIGGDTRMSSDGYVMSSADWDCWRRGWGGDTCAKGYLRETRRRDGGVVLMHCIKGKEADLLESYIPAMQEEGYRFVRLDEIPEYKQYETPPESEGPAVASNDAGVPTAAR